MRRGLAVAAGLIAVAGIARAQYWTGGTSPGGGGNAGVLATAAFTPMGRLTLTTRTPVISGTGVTGASTLFYTSYVGNLVPVFNGTSDVVLTIPNNEVSDALQASGSGVVSSGGVFDEWAVSSAGALTICHATNGSGGGWASDTAGSNTARGTGYSALAQGTRPYLTNANALANCYNGTTNLGTIAVNRATYLGTFTTTANGQTSITLGPPASGGTLGVFGVWNYYNRVIIRAIIGDTGAPYTYSGGAREAGGSTTNQMLFVSGVREDAIDAVYTARLFTAATAGANGTFGIGLDAATFAFQPFLCQTGTAASVNCAGATGGILGAQIGLHTVSANEAGDGSTLATFNAASGNTLTVAMRN